MPAEITFPISEGDFGEFPAHRFEKLWRRYIHGVNVGVADLLEISVPGPVRRQRPKLGTAHLVIGLFGIAPLDVREGSFGQLGFKTHDGLCLSGRLWSVVPNQRKHFGNVILVLPANLLRFVVCFGVIVAVRQPESSLIGPTDYARAIFHVLRGSKFKQPADTRALQPRNRWGRS